MLGAAPNGEVHKIKLITASPQKRFTLKVAKNDETAAIKPRIMPAKLFVPKAPM
jgi:hypothetical protein